MRAVNHNRLLLPLFLQRLLSKLDALRIIVCALGTTTQNHKSMLVAACPGDRSQTLFGDAHEVVSCSSGSNSINRDGQAAVCTIFESDREGEAGGKLSV